MNFFEFFGQRHGPKPRRSPCYAIAIIKVIIWILGNTKDRNLNPFSSYLSKEYDPIPPDVALP